jgi:hypothetical protein
MKFESKFGIGEIVIYRTHERADKSKNCPNGALLEVQGIYFGMDGETVYSCRYIGTGVTVGFSESQLVGDPEFNQDSGYNHD